MIALGRRMCRYLKSNRSVISIFVFCLCMSLVGLNLIYEHVVKIKCRNMSLDDSVYDYLRSLEIQIDKQPEWRPVNGIDEMVYSAFVDTNNSLVKIIGISPRKTRFKCRWCILYYRTHASRNLLVTSASLKTIPEHHSKRLSATYFICELPDNMVPDAVSVTYNLAEIPQNILPIMKQERQERNFTVCVSPFHLRYDDQYALLEMVELNKILGADHFVFYNFSTGPSVNQILKFYKEKGNIDILEWNLPIEADTVPTSDKLEVHYYAQMAAINDCLFRNKGVSKYVVFQDLDEFIIPRNHVNWKDMIKSFPPDKAAYLFRSSYFGTNLPDTNILFSRKSLGQNLSSNSLLKLRRDKKIFKENERSKYIVDPTRIETTGIHFIWSYKPGYKGVFIDPSVALVHHYGDVSILTVDNTEIDTSMMKYNDLLPGALNSSWTEFTKSGYCV